MVVLCSDPTREESVWWRLADPLGFINVDWFLRRISSAPITLKKHCGCNTGNPWLLQCDDTALFWYSHKSVSYEFIMKPKESANVTRPSPRRWGLGTRLMRLSWWGLVSQAASSQCGVGAGGCRSSHKSIETLIVSLNGLCQSIQEQLGQENFKWAWRSPPGLVPRSCMFVTCCTKFVRSASERIILYCECTKAWEWRNSPILSWNSLGLFWRMGGVRTQTLLVHMRYH